MQPLESSANLDHSAADQTPSSARTLGTSLVLASTGPRTLRGKERSSQNSLKQGIFSKAVVLKSESKADFEELHNGLRDSFQPVGAFEEGLVEMLAVTRWRQRRLLIAEAAEVQVSMEPFDGKEPVDFFEGLPVPLHYSGGLMKRIDTPQNMQKCLELLQTLRSRIEANGFDEQHDKDILVKVYGDASEDQTGNDLFKTYSRLPEIVRERGLNNCIIYLISKIDDQIKELIERKEKDRLNKLHEMKLNALRRSVPDSPRLDQFLRYGASLERTFDRTLNQLERAQRMRLGQPVPPPLNVNVSSS
jgi:hypothetical protein